MSILFCVFKLMTYRTWGCFLLLFFGGYLKGACDFFILCCGDFCVCWLWVCWFVLLFVCFSILAIAAIRSPGSKQLSSSVQEALNLVSYAKWPISITYHV